jgi:hypothetical protein
VKVIFTGSVLQSLLARRILRQLAQMRCFEFEKSLMPNRGGALPAGITSESCIYTHYVCIVSGFTSETCMYIYIYT